MLVGHLAVSDAAAGRQAAGGRPPKNPKRSSEPHKKRAAFEGWVPFHVTLRVERRMSELRRGDAYHAIRKAMEVVLAREDFRIVHVSLERGHLHLIVEASSHEGLARGMQAFQISAAKRFDAAGKRERRRGNVFVDRYPAVRIGSPTQARNANRYVLCDWRHHDHDKPTEDRSWRVDSFSSGPSFRGWAEYAREREPFPVHAGCRLRTRGCSGMAGGRPGRSACAMRPERCHIAGGVPHYPREVPRWLRCAA